MTICLIKLFFIHLNFFGSSFSCNSFSLCVLMYIILSHTLYLLTISLVPKRLSCVINCNHLLSFYIISLLNSNCKRILMRFCYNYFLKSLFYVVFSVHKPRTYVGYELYLFSFIYFCSTVGTKVKIFCTVGFKNVIRHFALRANYCIT